MFALLSGIVVALCMGAVAGWLVRDVLRQRRSRAAAIRLALRYSPRPIAMGRHDGHSEGAVTVAELLCRAAEQGHALRLNWSVDDTDPRGLATIDDDWPTGVLPTIEDDMPDPRTSGTLAELTCREPGTFPEPLRPVHVEDDPDLLDHVVRGLRRLDWPQSEPESGRSSTLRDPVTADPNSEDGVTGVVAAHGKHRAAPGARPAAAVHPDELTDRRKPTRGDLEE